MATDPVSRFSIMERFDKWRANAPEGYRWTTEEVLYEKEQSFYTGLITGSLVACFMVVLVVLVASI